MGTGSGGGGPIERPAAPERASVSAGARRGPLLLLLVLLAGLNVTSLTQGWLGAVPNHDHPFAGARGHVPHSHPGDRTGRSAAALAIVASPPGARAEVDASAETSVVSLGSFADAGLLSGAAGIAAIVGFALPAPPDHPRGYPTPGVAVRSGVRPQPGPRPPRHHRNSTLPIA